MHVNRRGHARRASRLEARIDRGGGRGDVARRSGSLAGATWIMRAALRGETLAGVYVALRGIPDLREVEVRENEVSIGAAITHAELAASLQRVRGCAGLAQAAAQAANPAIRRVATVGGNLCSVVFAASDLAPALVAAGAEVKFRMRGAPRVDQSKLSSLSARPCRRVGC